MPPKLIVALDGIDLEATIGNREDIDRRIPQRFEMAQLDAIHYLDREGRVVVGSRAIRADEWWVPGHIPGRPIFPGVLLVEAVAQLSTWLFKTLTDDLRFVGFAGIDGVRFRGAIQPGDRVVLLAKAREIGHRRSIFECQAAVDGKLVFEGVITGMAV